MSSVITISQPPTIPGGSKTAESNTDPAVGPFSPEVEVEITEPEDEDIFASSESELSDAEEKDRARQTSLEKLQSTPATPPPPQNTSSEKGKQKSLDVDFGFHRRLRRTRDRPDAVIVLREEKVRKGSSHRSHIEHELTSHFHQASTFHDFLKFVYPQSVPLVTTD